MKQANPKRNVLAYRNFPDESFETMSNLIGIMSKMDTKLKTKAEMFEEDDYIPNPSDEYRPSCAAECFY